VRGFALDPMHTVYAGCYGRRIQGFRSERGEGKLSSNQMQRIDKRILLFQKCKPSDFDRKLRPLSASQKYKHHEHRNLLMYYQFPAFDGIMKEEDLTTIMKLQKAMILLGRSQITPVPKLDTEEARLDIKSYIQDLKDNKIPINYMTHATLHVPDDVDFFGVGVERISAWIFESFQIFARNGVRQGNQVCEQIRNRLMERFLYLLPIHANGKIVSSEEMFELEVAKFKNKNSKSRIVIDFKIGRGKKPQKTVTFPGFTISNKFPNNVFFCCRMVLFLFVLIF
jgi:hypothetical protein